MAAMGVPTEAMGNVAVMALTGGSKKWMTISLRGAYKEYWWPWGMLDASVVRLGVRIYMPLVI